MSSNNNDNSAGAGLAILGAGIAFMAAFLFAIFAFLAAILTVLCLIALFTPVRLGKWTLEAEEARRFLWHGTIGAWLAPTFVLFCDVVFSLGIVWDYLPHMIGGGYVLGSLGWEILNANANPEPEAEIVPPAQQITHQQSRSQVSPWQRQEPETFGYASWDDEEEFRK